MPEIFLKTDRLRGLLGDRPIWVNSWYRPSHINKSVGGSKWSRHQFGDAVDIRSNYHSPQTIYKLLNKSTRWRSRSLLLVCAYRLAWRICEVDGVRSSTPTPCFWNCTGIAIAIVSVGVSWSLIRASNYKLEAANHKLEVSTAVSKVKKVSDTLTQSAELLPEAKKVQIKQQLKAAEAELVETTQEILTDEDDTEDREG